MSDEDPYDLDPFGGSEYDPSLAFARVAAIQAQKYVESANEYIARQRASRPHVTDQVSASACKSVDLQIRDLRQLAAEARLFYERAKEQKKHSAKLAELVGAAINRFHQLRAIHERLMMTAHNITQEGGIYRLPTSREIDPTLLNNPRHASRQADQHLRQWRDLWRSSHNGRLVVLKATPGVGKTHAMIRLAHQEQINRQRVVVGVRTKDMIHQPGSEMRRRLVQSSPSGGLSLSVIYGRDATNCHHPETVDAVTSHGYSPATTVCSQCEHHPDNSPDFGLGVCGYYRARMLADMYSKGARENIYQQYPLVLTTHASFVAATQVHDGRYGSFWDPDLALIDEDPTDALETDLLLSHGQCSFRSRSPETRAAGTMAHLCREAIDVARDQRARASDNGFRAPGEEERNSHPIHSRYDSVYTGQELEQVMRTALQRLAVTQNVSTLQDTLRSVGATRFSVPAGGLMSVESTDDINCLDIPPSSLAEIADAIHIQMVHAMQIRRIIYTKNMGTHPKGDSCGEVLNELSNHTDIMPMSYQVRLECLPMDLAKGRVRDEWRFVLRQFRPLRNRTAALVIGDAYAQKQHYEDLFERPAEMIDIVSQLNPDASFLRVLDSECGISRLRDGGLQRILALAENQLREEARPGDRVLIYGHQELRDRVEKWIANTLLPRGLVVAYEHWWGGRGKDQYNGWEFTVTISDPVLSVSGIKHRANARAFRASLQARRDDEKLLHAQCCEIEGHNHGAIYALRSSHPRIALEHERVNVAELTQASHRARPVHHPVRIISYGEMELSPDLVAQTESTLGPRSRKLMLASAQRTRSDRDDRPVDLFTTTHEAFRAIVGIIHHFGAYSRWFSHALVVRSRGSARAKLRQNERGSSGALRHTWNPEKSRISRGLRSNWSGNRAPALRIRSSVDQGADPEDQGANWVPDEWLDAMLARDVSEPPCGSGILRPTGAS